jgi:hypothetical protein
LADELDEDLSDLLFPSHDSWGLLQLLAAGPCDGGGRLVPALLKKQLQQPM